MPKRKNRIPSYRKHKPTGQAVVTLDGRDFYLGRYNSAASRAEYNRLIAEWLASNGTSKPPHDATVAELLAAFLRHAERYYLNSIGETSAEVANFKLAMRPLKSLYGRTRAADFGPLAFKAVRQKLVDDGASRNYANKCTNRIRHIFKWATENELLKKRRALSQ